MSRVYFILLALLPVLSFGQAEKPSGLYQSDKAKEQLQFRFNNDNTVDIITANGVYSVSNEVVTIDLKTPDSFTLTKENGNSAALQISFEPLDDLYGLATRYIYIGYEDDKGEVQYVSLYNKAQGEGNENDDKVTIEVPRTEHLYLANAYATAYKGKNAEVKIEKYAIGKNTNALKIQFNARGAVSRSLKLVRDSQNPEHYVLNEPEIYETPVVFTKVTNEPSLSLRPQSTEAVKKWKHLIAFEEESNIPEYNPEKSKNAIAPIKEHKSLNEALAAAAKNKRLLLVFLQPNNNTAKEEFNSLLNSYSSGSSDDDEYAYSNKFRYELYLATAKEAKTLTKKGIGSGNQVVLLNAAGDVIYHQEGTIAQQEAEDLLENDRYENIFQTLAIAYELDKVLGNPKSTTKEVENTFSNLLNNDSSQIFLLAENRPKEQDADDQKTYEENTKDYLKKLKNPKGFRKLQLTPATLENQWKRVVDSHLKDKNLDAKYAQLLVLAGVTEYYEKVFAQTPTPTATYMDVVDYLLRFKDEIAAHNKKVLGKDPDATDEDYIPYSERIEKGAIEVSYKQQCNGLENLAEKNKDLLPRIKSIYEKGLQLGVYEPNDYLDFLYENDAEGAGVYFAEYFNNITQKDSNLIAALDKAYTESKDAYSWRTFKMYFANRANNIAWKVYEYDHSDKDKLKAPYQWAKAAVQLEPENPFYIDTLAHLVYVLESKEKGIELEEKAVQLMDKYEDGSEAERAEIKKNYEAMKAR